MMQHSVEDSPLSLYPRALSPLSLIHTHVYIFYVSTLFHFQLVSISFSFVSNVSQCLLAYLSTHIHSCTSSCSILSLSSQTSFHHERVR